MYVDLLAAAIISCLRSVLLESMVGAAAMFVNEWSFTDCEMQEENVYGFSVESALR